MHRLNLVVLRDGDRIVCHLSPLRFQSILTIY